LNFINFLNKKLNEYSPFHPPFPFNPALLDPFMFRCKRKERRVFAKGREDGMICLCSLAHHFALFAFLLLLLVAKNVTPYSTFKNQKFSPLLMNDPINAQ
jgi:hypothetical protein